DTTTHRIAPAHIIASGSLPPGFPATEIDGEYYWDGGIVSNTPLQWVLDSRPRRDTLAFQIDLWSAQGEPPRNLVDADVRAKEIRFSSRTRAATDLYKSTQLPCWRQNFCSRSSPPSTARRASASWSSTISATSI